MSGDQAAGSPQDRPHSARATQISARRSRLVGRLSGRPPVLGPVDPAVRRTAGTDTERPLGGSGIGSFYDSVSAALDATEVGQWALFLNYGYLESDDDRSPIDLPRNTLDRASVKLVLELVGDFSVDGRRVLDVGSGRGGTVDTLLRYFAPASVTGVDLSPAAVAFCRRSSGGRAGFAVADAQHLPFRDGAFDVVTNVESAHCYPDPDAFYAEVARVLGPGGVFLYTDLLETSTLEERQALLARRGLRLELERDITSNVLAACDQIAQRRRASFAAADDGVLGNFLAVPGSPVYEAMRSGETTYFIWRLTSASAPPRVMTVS